MGIGSVPARLYALDAEPRRNSAHRSEGTQGRPPQSPSDPGNHNAHASILVPLLFAAAPASAQSVVIPVRCHGECPPDRLPRTLALDSVKVWANLEQGQARTSVTSDFRNDGANALDAAFFFPLPADAVVYSVSVVDSDMAPHEPNRLLQYNEWSRPDESRWILQGIVRDRPNVRLREYTRGAVVHVPLRDVPAGAGRQVQIQYTQPLRPEDGRVAYRFPFSVGAAAAPVGHLTLGLTVTTEAGFDDLRSPSHAVDVQWGTESAPCPPRFACGTRGVPSERQKIVRLREDGDVRGRDFELIYVPREPTPDRRSASVP